MVGTSDALRPDYDFHSAVGVGVAPILSALSEGPLFSLTGASPPACWGGRGGLYA